MVKNILLLISCVGLLCSCVGPSNYNYARIVFTGTGLEATNDIFDLSVCRILDGNRDVVFSGGIEMTSVYYSSLQVPAFDTLVFEVVNPVDNIESTAIFKKSEWDGQKRIWVHVITETITHPSESDIDAEFDMGITIEYEELFEPTTTTYIKQIEIKLVDDDWSVF